MLAKLFGGGAAILALLLGVQTMRLSSTKHALEKEQHRLVIIGGALDRQNHAVAEMAKQAKTKAEAADKAVSAAVKHGDDARRQADRIDRTPRQPSGHCETPADVRGIQL